MTDEVEQLEQKIVRLTLESAKMKNEIELTKSILEKKKKEIELTIKQEFDKDLKSAALHLQKARNIILKIREEKSETLNKEINYIVEGLGFPDSFVALRYSSDPKFWESSTVYCGHAIDLQEKCPDIVQFLEENE